MKYLTFLNEKVKSSDFKINSQLSNNDPVKIHDNFNISVEIEFPDIEFKGNIKLKVSTDQTFKDRVNLCSIVPNSNGENMVCTKCLRKIEPILTENSFEWSYMGFQNFRFIDYSSRSKKDTNILRYYIFFTF